jgi:hypothetical protein
VAVYDRKPFCSARSLRPAAGSSGCTGSTTATPSARRRTATPCPASPELLLIYTDTTRMAGVPSRGSGLCRFCHPHNHHPRGTTMSKQKAVSFSLGRIVATPGALAALEKVGKAPIDYLQRHARGDWGEALGDEDSRPTPMPSSTARACSPPTCCPTKPSCGSSRTAWSIPDTGERYATTLSPGGVLSHEDRNHSQHDDPLPLRAAARRVHRRARVRRCHRVGRRQSACVEDRHRHEEQGLRARLVRLHRVGAEEHGPRGHP